MKLAVTGVHHMGIILYGIAYKSIKEYGNYG
jgi:hypothetical protein